MVEFVFGLSGNRPARTEREGPLEEVQARGLPKPNRWKVTFFWEEMSHPCTGF
jgi:hypothetical protein